MSEVSATRQDTPFNLTKREKWRERLWLLIILVLFLSLTVAIVAALSFYQKLTNPENYRSESEMINGGKRFIDNFYSLNAATVDRDQFRAISMMMQQTDKDQRLNYLITTDFVRETQRSRMKSEIDWSNSESEVLDHLDDGVVDIEYKAYLVRNDEKAGLLDIILRLVPVEKNDDNTDGVGVWAWKDVSENPFEGQHDDTF